MKTTTVTRTLPLLAALLLALSLALACGDDDGGDNPSPSSNSDTLTGYFADVQRIFQDAEDATNNAERSLNYVSAEAALDTKLSALDWYLGEIDTIFNEGIGQLEGLVVPAAAADGHENFVDGVRESIAAGNALRDDLLNIATKEQLDDRLAQFNSDIDAAVDRTGAACAALQEVADTEDISVDLDCEV